MLATAGTGLGAVVVPAIVTSGPAAAVSPGRAYDIEQVSVPPAGAQPFTDAVAVGASEDGRYVAFVATGGGAGDCLYSQSVAVRRRSRRVVASTPTPGPKKPSAQAGKPAVPVAVPYDDPTDAPEPCYVDQLFLRDRQAGTTTLVSHAVGDPDAPGGQVDPSDAAISADGSTLAFLPDDQQVYVIERASDAVHKVTLPDLGADGTGSTDTVASWSGVSLSADGRRIAFVAASADATVSRAVVADWADGTSSVLGGGNDRYFAPQLSADGTTLAVRDGRTVQVLTVDTGSPLAAADLADPDGEFSLAADGSSLAVTARVPADGEGEGEGDADGIVVHNLRDPRAPTITVATPADSEPEDPQLSRDGTALAFGAGGQVYVAAPAAAGADAVALVSAAPDGSAVDADDSWPVAVVQDGAGVVFDSDASDLVPSVVGAAGDYQVYVATSADTAAPTWPDGASLSAGTGGTFGTIELSWPAAGDDVAITGYQVSENGGPLTSVGATTSYTVPNLQAGREYSFGVRAVDAAGHLSATTLTASASTAPRAATYDIDRVSAPRDEDPYTFSAGGPAISGDGRYVAYTGTEAFTGPLLRVAGPKTPRKVTKKAGKNAGPSVKRAPVGRSATAADERARALAATAGCDDCNQVYLADRQHGTVTVLSHAAGDPATSGDHDSRLGAVSGDGSTVAFTSGAGNLTDEATGLYVADVATNTVTAVELPTTHGDPDESVSLSGDGSLLAYSVYDYAAGYSHLIVHNLADGSDELDKHDFPQHDSIIGLALSGDGKWLAYEVLGDNYVYDLHLYDLTNEQDATVAASLNTGYSSDPPTITADGSLIAYDAGGDADTNVAEIYDRTTGQSTPITDPAPGGSGPSGPTLSADGSTLAFTVHTPHGEQVFQATPPTGAATLVNQRPDGTPSPWGSYRVPDRLALSANGAVLAFASGDAALTDDPAQASHPSDEDTAIYAAHLPDTVPPIWPDGAALSVHSGSLTATSVRLDWPTADDDQGLAGYTLTRDGATIASPGAAATSYPVTGLTAGTAYQFQISARDGAGNTTALPALSVMTPAAAGAGDAALSAVAGPGGVATLRWDAASPAPAHYRILRAVGEDGTLAPVGEVDPDATSYDDSGLLAATGYRYRVETVDAAGNATAYTAVTGVDTPEVTVSSVGFSAPLVDGARAAQYGTDVTVRLTGDPNRTGTGNVTYRMADSVFATTAGIALTETSTPGHYSGTLTIPDGATAITAVTGVLTDGQSGAGHSARADAPGLSDPLPVSGALRVTIDPPGGDASIAGSKLTALSAGIDAGAQASIDGPGTFSLPLAASGDYALTLRLADGYVMAAQTGVAVAAGSLRTLTLTPALPASLSVTTDAALWPAQVDVYGSDGTFLGTGTNRVNMDGLASNATVTIKTTALHDSAPVTKRQSQTVELGPGANHAEISAHPLPTATITGKVTQAGAPQYAGVTATEIVDGRPWTFTTHTSVDGTYSLSVLAGEVTVSANSYDSPTPVSESLTVGAGNTADADLELYASSHYQHFQMRLSIVTEEPGGGTSTLPLDWTTAIHFQAVLSAPGRQYTGFQITPMMDIVGTAGEKVSLCVDGTQAGLGSACNSVTLTESADPLDLSVTLAGAGRITGSLLTATGDPYAGHWNAQTYRITGTGQRESVNSIGGSGSELSLNVPSAGRYEVEITGAVATAWVDVMVPDGGVVDAGPIVLGSNPDLAAGTNSVLATPSSLTPGQVVQVRVAYASSNKHVRQILLGIPAGSSLVPGDVAVDGTEVADPDVTDGFAAVPVGADTGTVTYALQTTPETPAGTLALVVRADLGPGDSTRVGSATVTVAGVTLALPSKIKGLTATASGQAPAGAPVTVYDELGQIVGTAIGTAGGLWQATLTLANRGEGHEYTLHATSTLAGVTVQSSTQLVTHNSHFVLPTTLSMQQADGRVVEFDPSTGVARFPYVFRPGQGVQATACFGDDAARVSDLQFRVGSAAGGAGVAVATGSEFAGDSFGPMVRTLDAGGGGCFTASMNPTVEQLGPVYLDYDSTPAPFTAEELQLPPGAAQESLPPVLAGVSSDDVVDNGDGSTTLSAGLPGNGSLQMTTTVHEVDYTPTQADLDAATESGVPVYQPSSSIDFGTGGTGIDTVSGTIHAYLLKSWLPDGTASASVRRSAGAFRPLLAIPVERAIEVTISVVGSGESLKDALGGGDAYQQLSKLLDALDQCADPFTINNDTEYIREVGESLAKGQAVGALVSLAGATLGFALGPIGSGLVGLALDKAFDAAQNKTLRDVARNIAEDLSSPQCKRHDGDEVADPDWIIDPSGYVYEAVTSDRLEGVTATLLQSDSPDGPFRVWDAAAYGQVNPMPTDPEGEYGWNVPFGYWQVAYTKDGYQTAYSPVFRVPPPQLDVNVGLVRLAAPTVTIAKATAGPASGVTVGFDDWMKIDSVTGRITVTDNHGNAITGTVAPIDAQTSPGGVALARTFRFTPDQPLAGGQSVTVAVGELVRDYADHTLDSGYSGSLAAGVASGPQEPGHVRAFAGTDRATIEFAHPGYDGGSPITGYRMSVTPGGPIMTVPADATSATVTGLDPDTDYTINLAALNAIGPSPAVAVSVHTFAVQSADTGGGDTGGDGGGGGETGGGGSEPSGAVSVTVAAGGTASSSTDPAPSAGTPIIASVTDPNPGTITFTPTAAGPAESGFTALGAGFAIAAPTATATDPLRLVFQVDDAILPAGADVTTLTAFRDGIPVPDCAGAGATADPDPCLTSATTRDAITTLVVLSSHASTWTFGVRTPASASVAKVKVATGGPATVGHRQRVAVRVWNSDGRLAANAVVRISVAGADTVTGTARTGPLGELGVFYYTPAHPGTHTITARVNGHSAITTVRIGRTVQLPTLGAVSRAAGTVNVAVLTHPHVAGRKVTVYYVEKRHGHKATLVPAGHAITDERGRVHLVIPLPAGRSFTLKARMSGTRDYVEKLSAPATVRVRH